jgi:HprK-related kinase A
MQIRSPFDEVAEAMQIHYSGYEALDDDAFADFEVVVASPPGLRRYVRRQAVFRFEDYAPFRPLPAAHAFPLLEWGLNWCVSAHCHQYLIIHAGVVARDERALILPAPPGAGKSTLCAALVARGWRLLSDELALLDLRNGDLVPMPRPISLKNESIDAIAAFWRDAAITKPVSGTAKGSVSHASAPRTSVERAERTAAPGFVVVPRYERGVGAEMAPLSRADAFMQLVEQAMNYSVHGRRGFEALANLVDASACHRFVYGGDLDLATREFDVLARSLR